MKGIKSLALLTSAGIPFYFNQKNKIAYCAPSNDEKSVEDLDKIFGSTEGGIPPDPEEI